MSYRPRIVLPGDQIGEVGGDIMRALPNALRMLQKQGIVTARQAAGYAKDLPRLSCALAAMFKDLYNNTADIAILLERNYIDCDAAPFVPDGYGVTEHKRSDRLFWDSERQGDALLLPADRDGRREEFIVSAVMGQIQNLPVLNANVLDGLLEKRHPTPERWDGKEIYFPGTLYFVYGSGPLVRGLHKQDDDLVEVRARLKEVWNKHLIALRA